MSAWEKVKGTFKDGLNDDISETLFDLNLKVDTQVMRTEVNGIKIEWSKLTNRGVSSSLKNHNLEDQESTLITSNITNDTQKLSLTCMFSKLVEHESVELSGEESYEQLIKLWSTKQIVTLTADRIYENLFITDISRNIDNIDEVEFTMRFEQVDFVQMMHKSGSENVDKDNYTQLSKERKSNGMQSMSTENNGDTIKIMGFEIDRSMLDKEVTILGKTYNLEEVLKQDIKIFGKEYNLEEILEEGIENLTLGTFEKLNVSPISNLLL